MRRSRHRFYESNKSTKIERVLVIDYSNLIHRTINSAVKDDKYCSDNYSLWKSYMMVGKNSHDGIFGMIMKHKPDRVIIALDERITWRKTVYPEYKAHRGAQRKKSLVNYEEFFPISDAFLEDLSKIFKNLIFFKVPNCEADDLIAIVVKDIHTDCEVIIASNDKDFYQCQKYSNVRQYDPLNKDFKICPNPEVALRVKIITGDRNDGIPGIKFRTGPKTAEKILNEGLDDFLNSEEGLRDKYILNRTLIDFDYIPNDIRESIIESYKNLKIEDMDHGGFFNFFVKHKLAGIAADFGIYSKYIERLI